MGQFIDYIFVYDAGGLYEGVQAPKLEILQGNVDSRDNYYHYVTKNNGRKLVGNFTVNTLDSDIRAFVGQV